MPPTLIQLGLTDRPAIAAVRRRAGGERALVDHLRAMLEAEGAPGVVLSTCERLEVYTLAQRGLTHAPSGCAAVLAGAGEPAHRVGLAAVEHLFRTAAGLESRMLGEAHILGQVGLAVADGAAGLDQSPMLRRLFESAVAAGRSVRAGSAIGSTGRSYAAAAYAAVEEWQAGSPREPATIGVLGSGSLALDITQLLRLRSVASRVVLLARHHERARGLIADPAVGVVPLAELSARLGGLGCIVAATAAADYLLTAADVQGSATPRLLIDLGVPANIDPACTAVPGVRLLTMDDLAPGSDAAAIQAARAAGELVARAAHRWSRRWLDQTGPSVEAAVHRARALTGGAA